jgi:2-polyprenyl-3-methyl-5-hydroxy-6-metoxy-1,4-benzoquinol methylase
MDQVQYWDTRYRSGGTSGPGSIGAIRDWKWDTIRSYTNPDNVIDVGCGDLSFWNNIVPDRYTGIDFAPAVIAANRTRHPGATFIAANAADTQSISAPVVVCMDMLFHIMDDVIYDRIVTNLGRYAREWLFVFTWHANPFADCRIAAAISADYIRQGRLLTALSMLRCGNTDHKYERYRKFEDSFPILADAGLDPVAIIPAGAIHPWGAMYIFHRSRFEK